MAAEIALTQFNDARAVKGPLQASNGSQAFLEDRSDFNGISNGFIALIESKTFIRECIRRSIQSALPLQVESFSNVVEMKRLADKLPKLILLSEVNNSNESCEDLFKAISLVTPGIPVIILAHNGNARMAKDAICSGAKGYIPVNSNFEITIEALRFVIAGGTYVPLDYLLMTPGDELPDSPQVPRPVTAREFAVVRAIQLGKSNKVIAYELGMSEGTVKVHVRRIMKKLKARNRTEVAIKSTDLLSCLQCRKQHECWSAGYCALRANPWT